MDRQDRAGRNMGEQGFTLIELLTVVAIIGVLAAIAIPQFAIYRQRGFDSTAQGDLRNAATAEEALYIANASYISCTDAADCQTKLPGYNWSNGVAIQMNSAGDTFTGTSTHSKGTGKVWSFDSTTGRIPE
jgi:prepilin-type N-terminal cleavage/methylation domain-containing protein